MESKHQLSQYKSETTFKVIMYERWGTVPFVEPCMYTTTFSCERFISWNTFLETYFWSGRQKKSTIMLNERLEKEKKKVLPSAFGIIVCLLRVEYRRQCRRPISNLLPRRPQALPNPHADEQKHNHATYALCITLRGQPHCKSPYRDNTARLLQIPTSSC